MPVGQRSFLRRWDRRRQGRVKPPQPPHQAKQGFRDKAPIVGPQPRVLAKGHREAIGDEAPVKPRALPKLKQKRKPSVRRSSTCFMTKRINKRLRDAAVIRNVRFARVFHSIGH
ncbi:MAG: DUF3306 domain-containing protein [Myxococcales bacterium]|nr:DUF3306 domain-containing protein [Myxococcales bacterium]